MKENDSDFATARWKWKNQISSLSVHIPRKKSYQYEEWIGNKKNRKCGYRPPKDSKSWDIPIAIHKNLWFLVCGRFLSQQKEVPRKWKHLRVLCWKKEILQKNERIVKKVLLEAEYVVENLLYLTESFLYEKTRILKTPTAEVSRVNELRTRTQQRMKWKDTVTVCFSGVLGTVWWSEIRGNLEMLSERRGWEEWPLSWM